MTRERAYEIIGSQPAWAVKNMIKALSMLSALNTDEENERLEAAKVWIKMGAAKRQEFFEINAAKRYSRKP